MGEIVKFTKENLTLIGWIYIGLTVIYNISNYNTLTLFDFLIHNLVIFGMGFCSATYLTSLLREWCEAGVESERND